LDAPPLQSARASRSEQRAKPAALLLDYKSGLHRIRSFVKGSQSTAAGSNEPHGMRCIVPDTAKSVASTKVNVAEVWRLFDLASLALLSDTYIRDEMLVKSTPTCTSKSSQLQTRYT